MNPAAISISVLSTDALIPPTIESELSQIIRSAVRNPWIKPTIAPHLAVSEIGLMIGTNSEKIPLDSRKTERAVQTRTLI